MKTKGLNFMEAVQAMKEGKKVRRNFWSQEKHIYMAYQNDLISTQEDKLFGAWISDVEATDWEIVDENWNLSKTGVKNDGSQNELETYNDKVYFCKDNIKRCRDLILQDFKKHGAGTLKNKSGCCNIVNKRFGDLE